MHLMHLMHLMLWMVRGEVVGVVEDTFPGWGPILLVAAVVAMLAVLVVTGIRDWVREASIDRAKREG